MNKTKGCLIANFATVPANAPSARGNPARPVWYSPPGAACAGWPGWECCWKNRLSRF
uniref:Uncharacterized protein n=1 Tax=Escherichia coli TaxID=562 RepID=A0A2S1JE66_ECOLX|nr:hypothetical protein [Escherichia coli]